MGRWDQSLQVAEGGDIKQSTETGGKRNWTEIQENSKSLEKENERSFVISYDRAASR